MSDEKSEFDIELSEREIAEAVADALSDLGFAASSQETGGGTVCVVLEHREGGEIVWGTADLNWGAVINEASGEFVSSIETTCASDTQDVPTIVKAIKGASLKNGAVISPS
jgi:hypothetical protein